MSLCSPQDGNVKCHNEDRKNCRPLSCPESQQFLVQGECCPTCLETTVDPQTDFPATIDPVVQDLDGLQGGEPDQFLDNPSSSPLTLRGCIPNLTDCGPGAHCGKGPYCQCSPGFQLRGSSCEGEFAEWYTRVGS